MRTVYQVLFFINYVFAVIGLLNGDYLQMIVSGLVAGIMIYAALSHEDAK